MQSSSQSVNDTKTVNGQLTEMNGAHLNQPAFPTIPGGTGMQKLIMEQVDPTALDDDSDSEDGQGAVPNFVSHGIKPGKKTKGRVKIKMEFIENKLRRYTTFSKRKTGIMKKAYELSTLTGTQVMLLVASETGHVYTFATRKLQPMITSESGKALIQTCLNSPDPSLDSQTQISTDQRMNPTGFEETELTYAVSEDEAVKMDGNKPVFAMSNPMSSLPTSINMSSEPLIQNHSSSPTPNQMSYANTQVSPQQSSQGQAINPSSLSIPSTSSNKSNVNNNSMTSLQLPTMPPGTVMLAPGTPLIPIQQNGQQITQQGGQQTLYRLPNSNQIVSLATTVGNSGVQQQQQQQLSSSSSSSDSSNTSTCTLTNVNPAGLNPNSAAAQAMTPGVVMYQTPQGIVYAPTTATLQDRSIFNFQQPATALSLPQSDGQQQQIITIPVPVSIAGSPQMLQFASQGSDTTTPVTLSQPSSAKKSRK